MPDLVAVEGLNEVRAAIKELGDLATSREFKQAGYDVVTDVVIPRAADRAAGLGPMQARAAATLQPARSISGAAVRYGAGVPWSMGAEFGSDRYHQFLPHRGRVGYFLYPTIRDDGDLIVDRFEEGIAPLVERLFPEGM